MNKWVQAHTGKGADKQMDGRIVDKLIELS